MRHDDIEFHNVRAFHAGPTHEGYLLQRIPERVRAPLNEDARQNYQRPAGVELRFVPSGPVRIRLSAPEGECSVRPFWGPFQGEAVTVGPDPTTLELAVPERLADLRSAVADRAAFAPHLCRLVFPHLGGPVRYHGVAGDRRPPEPDDRSRCGSRVPRTPVRTRVRSGPARSPSRRPRSTWSRGTGVTSGSTPSQGL